MKSIHFGAGKIGRGFIGAVLSKAGYEVCFADTNLKLVELINSEGRYDVHILDRESRTETISGISAVDSNSEECTRMFADVTLITTAVSMKVLPMVAPTVAKGIAFRRASGVGTPLDVICCENGIRATSQFKEMVFGHLDAATARWAESNVGFADSGVDRIAPIVEYDNPLDVAVEEYYEWNVDSTLLKSSLPPIPSVHLTDRLDAHIEKKLFTVNTGHCATAFFGNLKGYTYIHEAICDPQIFGLVQKAVGESGAALISKFGFAPDEYRNYSEAVLGRFRNPHLKDLVSRVGHDPRRKLGPTLYFSYPISMALQQGLPYEGLALAAAAGLRENIEGDPQCAEIRDMISAEGLEGAIRSITGLSNPAAISGIAEAFSILPSICE